MDISFIHSMCSLFIPGWEENLVGRRGAGRPFPFCILPTRLEIPPFIRVCLPTAILPFWYGAWGRYLQVFRAILIDTDTIHGPVVRYLGWVQVGCDFTTVGSGLPFAPGLFWYRCLFYIHTVHSFLIISLFLELSTERWEAGMPGGMGISIYLPPPPPFPATCLGGGLPGCFYVEVHFWVRLGGSSSPFHSGADRPLPLPPFISFLPACIYYHFTMQITVSCYLEYLPFHHHYLECDACCIHFWSIPFFHSFIHFVSDYISCIHSFILFWPVRWKMTVGGSTYCSVPTTTTESTHSTVHSDHSTWVPFYRSPAGHSSGDGGTTISTTILYHWNFYHSYYICSVLIIHILGGGWWELPFHLMGIHSFIPFRWFILRNSRFLISFILNHSILRLTLYSIRSVLFDDLTPTDLPFTYSTFVPLHYSDVCDGDRYHSFGDGGIPSTGHSTIVEIPDSMGGLQAIPGLEAYCCSTSTTDHHSDLTTVLEFVHFGRFRATILPFGPVLHHHSTYHCGAIWRLEASTILQITFHSTVFIHFHSFIFGLLFIHTSGRAILPLHSIRYHSGVSQIRPPFLFYYHSDAILGGGVRYHLFCSDGIHISFWGHSGFTILEFLEAISSGGGLFPGVGSQYSIIRPFDFILPFDTLTWSFHSITIHSIHSIRWFIRVDTNHSDHSDGLTDSFGIPFIRSFYHSIHSIPDTMEFIPFVLPFVGTIIHSHSDTFDSLSILMIHSFIHSFDSMMILFDTIRWFILFIHSFYSFIPTIHSIDTFGVHSLGEEAITISVFHSIHSMGKMIWRPIQSVGTRLGGVGWTCAIPLMMTVHDFIPVLSDFIHSISIHSDGEEGSPFWNVMIHSDQWEVGHLPLQSSFLPPGWGRRRRYSDAFQTYNLGGGSDALSLHSIIQLFDDHSFLTGDVMEASWLFGGDRLFNVASYSDGRCYSYSFVLTDSDRWLNATDRYFWSHSDFDHHSIPLPLSDTSTN